MELVKNSSPLYIQLKNILVNQIKENQLKPGERLPSERELCEKYSVSRITVRQALAELDNDGFIDRSHGKGTFVAQSKVEQELLTITPFQSSLLSRGMTPRTKHLDARIIPNSYHLSRILEIPLAEDVVELTLLGLGDDMPIAFYTSYFAYDLGLKIIDLTKERIAQNLSFTTLDLYKDIPGVKPGVVNQTFEASIADSYIANILEIKKGSPILIVESIIYSGEDVALEYRNVIYRGDKYKFSVVRRTKHE